MDTLTVLYGSLVGITVVMSMVGPYNPDMFLTRVLHTNFLPIILLSSFLGAVLCLVFNRLVAAESALGTMRGPAGYLWTLLARMDNKSAREEYAKAGAISDKLVRRATLGAWSFAPGLLWLAIALSFGVLFVVISLSSLIFLVSVVLWGVWHLRSPGAEKTIFSSLHGAASKHLAKGLFGHIVIIGGLFAAVMFFYLIISLALETANMQIMHLALPFAYLFYFWYKQGRRLSVFLRVWTRQQDPTEEISIPSLPAGGYPVFVISCFLSLANLLILSVHYPSFIFWILSLAISGLAVVVLLLSLKHSKKTLNSGNIGRDNFLIITAVLVQFVCADLVFWIFLEDSSFIFSSVLGTIFIFVWFLPDWQRFLKRKYRDKPIVELILRYGTYPVGLSPILIPQVKLFNLIYLGVVLLFGFIFYAELVGLLSLQKSRSVDKRNPED